MKSVNYPAVVPVPRTPWCLHKHRKCVIAGSKKAGDQDGSDELALLKVIPALMAKDSKGLGIVFTALAVRGVDTLGQVAVSVGTATFRKLKETHEKAFSPQPHMEEMYLCQQADQGVVEEDVVLPPIDRRVLVGSTTAVESVTNVGWHTEELPVPVVELGASTDPILIEESNSLSVSTQDQEVMQANVKGTSRRPPSLDSIPKENLRGGRHISMLSSPMGINTGRSSGNDLTSSSPMVSSGSIEGGPTPSGTSLSAIPNTGGGSGGRQGGGGNEGGGGGGGGGTNPSEGEHNNNDWKVYLFILLMTAALVFYIKRNKTRQDERSAQSNF